MHYANLMVHVDLDHSNDARMHIAGALAERFDAGIIGITARSEIQPLYFTDGYVTNFLAERDIAEIREKMQDAEQRFRAALEGHAKRIEWRSALAQPTGFVADQCRAADLVIVGGEPAGESPDPTRQLVPSDLVTRAGRPILVVPQEVDALKAERILIGWKDTREARRAVWDGLPFLKSCQEAVVVEIDDDKDPGAAHARVDDVVAWLAQHGVKAQGRVQPVIESTAAQLDTIAWEEGADLILAGAYGHSQFHEWVLGGTTRGLMARPRCSLLAH